MRDCDVDADQITVRSDSKYIIDAFNQGWLANWQRNGWRTANRKPVLNQDLWKRMLKATAGYHFTWVWVKGHSGDPMNERCDKLAVAEARFAPTTNGYWFSVGTPRSVASEQLQHQAETTPSETPAPTPPPEQEAMRILEAMSVALDECTTFESFRERMQRVMADIEW